MRFEDRGLLALAAFAAAAFIMSLALTICTAGAQDKTYVMKITLPTINDAPHVFAKKFAAAVEKDSGGRIKSEVYPASQLGSMSRQIEGVQFGAIQAAVIPPEFYVGVDERFEVMAAPGLVDDIRHGQRVAADPEVLKLMLSLGSEKGLHGAGLFIASPTCLLSRAPIRHLADFQGKKIRIFASDFQSTAFKRLGVTPVAMSLGDVLPALQQGAVDGAIAGIGPFVLMHFSDAAKFITETNQPSIFLIVEISKKWYDSLPADLQQIVDRDAAAESIAINPTALTMYEEQRKAWTDGGGELIKLPPDEQATFMKMLASVGTDVSNDKPAVREAYAVVTAAAQKTRQAPSQ
jgi:TRAP-type transport system periplasmic protein